MEIAKAAGFLKKYRYAALILCLGLLLMAFPVRKSPKPAVPEPVHPVQEVSMQQKLADILSRIRGAGQVQVLLTVAKGERIVYQTDNTHSREDDSSHTVLVTDASHAEGGLITQTIPPEYQGAIVVCQGADDPSVRLAITEAVSKVTGLGADRIAIMKMK